MKQITFLACVVAAILAMPACNPTQVSPIPTLGNDGIDAELPLPDDPPAQPEDDGQSSEDDGLLNNPGLDSFVDPEEGLGNADALSRNPAANTFRGMQFIGMSRATGQDITLTANVIAGSAGNLEVSLLPFEFNSSNPFGNASTLVQSVLPRINGNLRMTVYVKWFVHTDQQGRRDQDAFWEAWNNRRPNASQRQIRDQFLGRVGRLNAWVNEMRSWAASGGLGGKLSFVVSPVLEDTCASSKQAAFTAALNAIKSRQQADGTSATRYRRSCLSDNVFRVNGASLEMHGPWSGAARALQSGDTWSNDGTPYTAESFIRDQSAARGRGVHVLFWRGAFNGHPYAPRNWADRTVDPFTGANGNAEKGDLQRIIRS